MDGDNEMVKNLMGAMSGLLRLYFLNFNLFSTYLLFGLRTGNKSHIKEKHLQLYCPVWLYLPGG